jgi:Ras family protein
MYIYYVKTRKIVILGSKTVGKSSLVKRLIDNTFIEGYSPTIENRYHKHLKYQRVEYLLEIIDTAGHDDYVMLSSKYAIGIHGYILMFSITSRESYEMVRLIYHQLLDYTGLRDLQTERQVFTEEAKQLAHEWQCSFIECSARTDDQMSLVVQELMKIMDEDVLAKNAAPPPILSKPPQLLCRLM